MSTKAELQALLERVTKATEPDRQIDRVLAGYPVGTTKWRDIPPYTASLDAITALIERELAGWAHAHIKEKLRGCIGYVHNNLPMGEASLRWHEERAATPCLALTAAFLSAMIAQMEDEHADQG